MPTLERSFRSSILWTCAFVLVAAALAAPATPAEDAEQGYRMPPAPIPQIVDTPPTPGVSLSPDRTWMLLTERPILQPIAELAEPELRLAGLRIRARTNGQSRTRHLSGLTLMRVSDLSKRPVTGLPEGARIGSPNWSPDGNRIAFTITGENEIRLWVAEVDTARARQVGSQRLNGVAGSPCQWLSDSRTLICSTVPEERGGEPAAPTVPAGPVIQENAGRTAPARTYQDLLAGPHDEALFAHYLTAQLMRVAVSGEETRLGPPGMLWDFEPSPDGSYLLVQTIQRPFSYLVQINRFPRRIEVWDRAGKPVHLVADLPLQEEVPTAFGSVPTGPRSVTWRDDVAATLVWAEAQDGGDARKETDLRDRVFVRAAPFRGAPRVLADLGLRYAGIEWGDDDLALIGEWWWKTRQVRQWIVAPGDEQSDPRLLFDYSFEDRYNDPGNTVSVTNRFGRPVLLTAEDGKKIYLSGAGASPEGDRPFFDELELESGKTRRLWRSEAPNYERVVAPLDATARLLLTRRESKTDPPNYFARSLADDSLSQLTEFPHPTPQLVGLQKEMIRYEREDGVKLTATLYLPPGYSKEQGPLPMLVWAYPQEFKSADAAGQVTDSPYRFDSVGWWSPLLLLTQGYAVLDDPTLPIVGEGDVEPNDTFIEQLVSSAKAAVDEVVRRGVADRDRIAIAGHSYGAFMTANLLAHSDLFRAGIARSGAYNRTLTPFGFQSEERTLWEAPEIYFTMSPFMHAGKVDEPILLIHGQADNNSGTYPMQSERYFNALKGLGATARLVMLPHESHGYRARESVLHMWWETTEWLNQYVKNAPPRIAAEEEVCVLETGMGKMVFRFFDEQAPRTAANFKRLVREGFYDGKPFYRVVQGHVIQAGDGGENDEPTVPGEFGAHPHEIGAVGLARDEDPDSGNTEIYICHAPRPHLDGRYAVFGLLVEGFDVLERIGNVEIEEKWEGEVAFHQPVEPVVIERAYLETRPLE